MNIDNEKLYDALDNIAYVNRKGDFMMLPEDPKDEMPFLLFQLKKNIDIAIKKYCEDANNSERADFYGLNK